MNKWTVNIPNTLNKFSTVGRKVPWSGRGRAARFRSRFTKPYLSATDMGIKRKNSSIATASASTKNDGHSALPPAPTLPAKRRAISKAITPIAAVKPTRQVSRRGKIDTNPDHNVDICDGQEVLRASPDATGKEGDSGIILANPSCLKRTNGRGNVSSENSDSSLSEIEEPDISPPRKIKRSPLKSSIAAKKASDEIKAFKAEQAARKTTRASFQEDEDDYDDTFKSNRDGDDAALEDVDIVRKEAQRPPPVNSDYLPLPWKGRLGYVSLQQTFVKGCLT